MNGPPFLILLHTCGACGVRWSQLARHPVGDCGCGARRDKNQVMVQPAPWPPGGTT